MFFEKAKLIYRANKYKNKDDKGGIDFILKNIAPGQTVFDIGAHKGGYLYFIKKQVGDEGKIIAFEPQSTLFNYLLKMKDLFQWKNVSLEHLALSDKAGTTTLYIPSNKSKTTSPGATIVEHPERNDFGATEEIKTESLDEYSKRKNLSPDFLKIDVEGNELRIFKGGIETLKRCKPKILVEIEARHVGKDQVLETFKFLEEIGYEGKFIYGMQRIPVREFSFEKHQAPGVKPYCNNFTFE